MLIHKIKQWVGKHITKFGKWVDPTVSDRVPRQKGWKQHEHSNMQPKKKRRKK